MPQPPKAGQTQSQYVSECMADPQMQNEFPDKDQRLAVCYAEWKKAKS